MPTLSLTESQAMTVLRQFIMGLLPTTTAGANPTAIPTPVIRGQINRVAEPAANDFVVLTSMRQPRLSTNIVTFQDNGIIGSIAGTTLTVTTIMFGKLSPGLTVIDEAGNVPNNTTIVQQLTGNTGGTGTYQLSTSSTVAQEAMFAGARYDLVQTEMDVQIDVHGPNSFDNTKLIEGMFRSDYATTSFAETGFDIQPLYASDPVQAPFLNAEQQYEYRWSFEARMQINPVIGTPQQFAAVLKAVVALADGEPNDINDDSGNPLVNQ